MKIKKLKPIELLACLQVEKDGKDEYFFYAPPGGFSAGLGGIKNICRVAKNVNDEGHDLIVSNNQYVYLGYWNDGVL